MALAYFKDNVLIGFYSDSFGTIAKDFPKIYTYSESQLDTIKTNVEYTLKKVRENITENTGDIIAKVNPVGGALLSAGLSSHHNKIKELNEFELRALPCPGYIGEDWIYPKDEIIKWKSMVTAIVPIKILNFKV